MPTYGSSEDGKRDLAGVLIAGPLLQHQPGRPERRITADPPPGARPSFNHLKSVYFLRWKVSRIEVSSQELIYGAPLAEADLMHASSHHHATWCRNALGRRVRTLLAVIAIHETFDDPLE